MFSGNAHAILPLVAIPASYYVASAVLHVAVAGVAIYAAMKSGQSPSVSSSAVVSRPSQVTWVNLADMTVTEKSVTATMPAATLKTISAKKNTDNTNKYPTIQPLVADKTDSYDQAGGYTGVFNNPSAAAGKTLSSDGNLLKLGSYVGRVSNATRLKAGVNVSWYWSGGDPCAFVHISDSVAEKYILAGINGSGYAQSPTVVTPKSNADIATALANSGTSGAVKSSYKNEIDKMMQDDDYVPTFTDDNTAGALQYPNLVAAATPAQITDYNTSVTNANDAATANSTAQAAATASASSPTKVNADAAQAAAQAAITAANSARLLSQGANNTTMTTAAFQAALASATAAQQAALSAANNYSIASNAGALTSAQSAVTTAQAGVTTAQTAYNNNANDTTLAALTAAQNALATAQSNLGTAQAASAAAQNTENQTTNIFNKSNPSAYGDGSTIDFGARFTSFINSMKTHSLFSMPNSILNASGLSGMTGTSTMVVSFGRFGSYTYDFANFSSALVVLRSVLMIGFAYTGFRIITLKGGSG